MAYLTRWRLQLAARELVATSRGVAEVATDVGYESEAAFSRGFKREFGLPPARYRWEQGAAANHYAVATGS
jgi:transcriptional regulator GlxA family with amidase domain